MLYAEQKSLDSFSADVIVMHNVFEFFTEDQNLDKMWSFVIGALRRPGTQLVTCPSLENSLQPIGVSCREI